MYVNYEVVCLQLQEALMTYRGMLHPLLDKCGINTEDDVRTQKFYGSHTQYR